MMHPDVCVIIFAKEPVPGRVKTRLIPTLGAQGACDLHQALLSKLLQRLQTGDLCHYQLWVDNNPEHSAFTSFKGECHLQSGRSLGEKMHAAVVTSLRLFKYVVIIGSDCPQMDEQYLRQAIEGLKSGNQVVFGPAEDGGYTLIGLASVINAVFVGIDWGSDQVLSQSQAILRKHKIEWLCLKELFDIDRAEDLKRLEASYLH